MNLKITGLICALAGAFGSVAIIPQASAASSPKDFRADADGGSIGGDLNEPGPLAPCLIADPTNTPLNVRTAPNGRVIANVINGSRAKIIDSTTDQNGKPWVYIADATGKPIGWVFRQFITCK